MKMIPTKLCCIVSIICSSALAGPQVAVEINDIKISAPNKTGLVKNRPIVVSIFPQLRNKNKPHQIFTLEDCLTRKASKSNRKKCRNYRRTLYLQKVQGHRNRVEWPSATVREFGRRQNQQPLQQLKILLAAAIGCLVQLRHPSAILHVFAVQL